MIQSMTGFGKSTVDYMDKRISIQLKSLNSKKLDLYARIPAAYQEKELVFNKIITESLDRGKVDFTLNVESISGETSAKLNHAVIKNYMEDLRLVAGNNSVNDVDLLKIAITLPHTLKTEKEEIDEEEIKAIEKGLVEAIENLNRFRSDEGMVLEKDFRLRIKIIAESLDAVATIDPERMERMRERLNQAISELKENVDENRFEQELIYYLEKFDITEEKTRLKSHLDYFLKTLDAPVSNGRKLGFICQEIGREINTIGSKSNYAPMQKLVVIMKDELEKIKEQILNVL